MTYTTCPTPAELFAAIAWSDTTDYRPADDDAEWVAMAADERAEALLGYAAEVARR